MLSLDKTKSIEEVSSFLKGHDWIIMGKMDGLTCSLTYKNGYLYRAETRGNGIIGEDITHNAKVISSIPQQIKFKGKLVVDGEIICTYKDFKQFKDAYKNPRNFASGSIRLLDSQECATRHLTFVAWDVIEGSEEKCLSNSLAWLDKMGFEIVPFHIDYPLDTYLEGYIKSIKHLCEDLSYPIDGLVFKYDNIADYNAAGRTDHHFKGGLAYKFYDETYPTKLRNIEWTMGRTGVLTPVAIFDPIDIDGSTVERASLHNVSVMKETLGECAYIGESLEVAKANQIIPQIYSAGPHYNHEELLTAEKVPANDVIEKCPICGHEVDYIEENGVTRVYCSNPMCSGKLINRLDHFCGKKGLDIKGISKMTMEKLIDWGWVNSLGDIFNLSNHRDEWIKKSGFGVTSVDKVLKAIEEGRKCTFETYLCAIGIPLIGKVASKALMNIFHSYDEFRKAIDEKDERLYQIDGIGEVMIDTLLNFDYTEADFIFNEFIKETAAVSSTNDDNLKGKVFVITGKLTSYKNRDALKKEIESRGGKVTSSVTSKTSYLINNDVNSTSSKNVTAKKLGIPIISEEDFKNL
jgi:DNA ligase (NAD+)